MTDCAQTFYLPQTDVLSQLELDEIFLSVNDLYISVIRQLRDVSSFEEANIIFCEEIFRSFLRILRDYLRSQSEVSFNGGL